MESDMQDPRILLPGMRKVHHNMTGGNNWYDSKPGYIYRLSSYDIKIESK